jgi:hypothetical protein
VVEEDASASFKDVKGTQLAFAAEIADAEPPKPHTHAEAADVE